ncbi:MAG TPA: lipid-A-disaccharide synthase [Gemmata sp.]|nr:lipid-A-disaccharide synthase [Gemmata sp.]
MHFFLSAGEPSGDLHGSNLIRALRAHDANVQVTGFGGPRMAAAGAQLRYPLTELAVMGVRRVVRHLPTFFRLAADAEGVFRDQRPDAVVLIDYPGFNFALARRAHARGVPVYYFVPPQLWAWRRGRVREVRKWCAGVLTALPFEDEWYRSRGVATHYVGHPYFDELASQRLDEDYLAKQRGKGGRIVALLPGSRDQEVAANTRMMLAVAERLASTQPGVRFLVAAFNDRQAGVVREMAGAADLPIEVHVGRTPEVIDLADACLAVSGSVGLELLYRLKPTVVIYRMNPVSLWLARRLVKLKFFSLVNLLADEELFPEIATSGDESERIAGYLHGWLSSRSERDEAVTRLREVRDRVAVPGACDRAARFLLEAMSKRHAA